MTTIRVKGLGKAIRDLRKKGEQGERIVKDYLADTATGIELKAIQKAPSSIGGQILNIRQRIDKVAENSGFNWKIGVQGSEDFDAYVEFGTGISAKQILSDPKYTSDIKALAMQFYKNGLGTLPGRPYLFPAWFEETANIVDDLKKELKALEK
jgi:hypothetical protein